MHSPQKADPLRTRGIVVERERLHRILDAWPTQRLIYLHAPAGYGKTMLVRRWLERSGIDARTAWLSLDARHADPHRLLRDLAAALERIAPGAVSRVARARAADDHDPMRALAALFDAPRTDDADQLLVLDDVQHLAPQAASQSLLAALIERAPSHFHFLTISRSTVEPALARAMATHPSMEITEAQMRFDAAEIAAYMEKMEGAPPSAESVAVAVARTAGWIVTLKLAYLTPQTDGHHAPHADMRGDARWLVQYLTTEVLHQQTPELQEFLLMIAIPEDFNAALCGAVTQSPLAHARLQQALDAGLPIFPLDEHTPQPRFRLHPLLREVLLAELARTRTADEMSELHRRAARWATDHDDVIAAVRHFLASDDVAAAIDLAEKRLRSIIVRGDVLIADRILHMLPQPIVAVHARLLMDRCLLEMLNDRPTLGETVRRTFETIARAPLDDRQRMHYTTETRIYQSAALLLEMRINDAAQTAAAVQQDEQHLDALGRAFLNYLHMHIARILGDHDRMLHSAEIALHHAEHAEIGWLYISIWCERGWMAMQLGRSVEAQECFGEAIGWKRYSSHLIDIEMGITMFYAAYNAYLCNDITLSQRVVHDAQALIARRKDAALGEMLRCLAFLADPAQSNFSLQRTPKAWTIEGIDGPTQNPILTVMRIFTLLRSNQVEAAWQQAAKLRIDPKETPTERKLLITSAWLLAYVERDIDLSVVADLITRSIAVAKSCSNMLNLTRLCLVSARRLFRVQKPKLAQQALRTALDQVHESGYIRLLLDMPELIEHAMHMDHPACQTLLQHTHSPQRWQALATLSTRERRCLNLLLDGHGYADIARIEVISLNTVRTHVRNLYRKLGVNRREDLALFAQRGDAEQP
jgi:ATP/maltotriose-dependent transcriptional regulator MalT